MNQPKAIVARGTCPFSADEHSLLAQLLATPMSPAPWAAARLSPTRTDTAQRPAPSRPVGQARRWRPVGLAATALLVSSLAASSAGVSLARSAPSSSRLPRPASRLAAAFAEHQALARLSVAPAEPASQLLVVPGGRPTFGAAALAIAADTAPARQAAAATVAGFNQLTAAPASHKVARGSRLAAPTPADAGLLTMLLDTALATGQPPSLGLDRSAGAGSSASAVVSAAAAEAAAKAAAAADSALLEGLLSEEPPPPPAPPFPPASVEAFGEPAAIYAQPLPARAPAPARATRHVALHANGTLRGNVYTVALGDTLWSIAVRAYGDGYRWRDILNANPRYLRGHQNNIRAGQQLTLPTRTVPRTAAVPLRANGTLRGNIYTVARGDTLWSVAVRMYGDGQQWPTILRANESLLHGFHGNLRGGQQLRIP